MEEKSGACLIPGLHGMIRYAALCLLLLESTILSYADLLPGIWYEFGFDPNHSPLAAGCQPDDPVGVPCRPGIGSVNLDTPPWTFTSLEPVDFIITDGFLSGDSFDVLDFGVLVGSTPAVALGHFCGLDPNICIADSEMSHSSFLLPAGAHSITVSVASAQILGEGFFQFTTPVPEPSTAFLMGSVLFVFWRVASRHLPGE
jgi:hypothetical protein